MGGPKIKVRPKFKPMTEEEIVRDTALCDSAAPEPWEHLPDIGVWSSDGKSVVVALPENNAAFIAAARTGWPRALSEIRRLQRQVKLRTKCSFCDKSQLEVRSLVAGPRGGYICNECVGLCVNMMKEKED